TGIVKLLGKGKGIPRGCHRSLSLRSLRKPCHVAPRRERPLTEHAIMGSAHQMSTTAKKVIEGTMNREKTLGLPRSFEAVHLTLSVSGGLRGDFSAIVLPLALAVFDTGKEFSPRRAIAAQLISH